MPEPLAVLTQWPDEDTDALRELPEWEQDRALGWVMESGELTGTGAGHAHRITDNPLLTLAQ